MNKTFKLNPNNNMLQNCLVFLTLSPLILVGGTALILGVGFVLLSIISALPFLGLFYYLHLIIEQEEEKAKEYNESNI